MDWTFKMTLHEGNYNFSCVMSIPIDMTSNTVEACDFVPCALQFTQVPAQIDKRMGGGYVYWPNRVSIKKI